MGSANVWDVTAEDVLKLQLDLHRSSAVLKIVATNAKECGQRATTLERKREAALERERQRAKTMPPVNPPIIPRPPPVNPKPPMPRAVVEIIDHETVRRNGVLLKKKYLPIGRKEPG